LEIAQPQKYGRMTKPCSERLSQIRNPQPTAKKRKRNGTPSVIRRVKVSLVWLHKLLTVLHTGLSDFLGGSPIASPNDRSFTANNGFADPPRTQNMGFPNPRKNGFGTNPTFVWDLFGTFCFLLLDGGIQGQDYNRKF